MASRSSSWDRQQAEPTAAAAMCCWRAMETEGREMRMAHGGRDVERIGLRGHRRSGNIRATIERARNEERGGAAWLTACAAALATGRHAAAQPRHLLQRGRGHGASSTVCIQPTGRGWRLGSAVRSAAQCGSGERILIGGEERERERARDQRVDLGDRGESPRGGQRAVCL